MTRHLNVGYLIKHQLRRDIVTAEFNRALALESLFEKRGHRFRIVPGYSSGAGEPLSSPERPAVGARELVGRYRAAVKRYRDAAADVNVLILSMSGPLSALAGWHAIRNVDAPVVLHVADIPSLYEIEKAGSGPRARWKWRWFRAIEKRIYKRSDHIVVVSPRFKTAIERFRVDPSKISTLPNAVDRRRIRRAVPLSIEKYGLNHHSSAFRAVYSGNMTDMPGLDLLLDVALRLRETDIEILLVGDGPLRADLETRARHDKLANVTFIGSMPYEESAQLVGMCDVALIPLVDGLESTIPSKLYVALACKTPVVGIGPTRGALADLVALTECGVMLPRDPELLADTLGVLARSPQLLREFRKKERQWAETFDSETVYSHFVKIVEGLAGGAPIQPIDYLQIAKSRAGSRSGSERTERLRSAY